MITFSLKGTSISEIRQFFLRIGKLQLVRFLVVAQSAAAPESSFVVQLAHLLKTHPFGLIEVPGKRYQIIKELFYGY